MLKKLALLIASTILTALFIALVVSIALLIQYRFDQRQAAIFPQVKVGDSISVLEKLAGSPSYETDGTRWVEPEFQRSKEELIPGCVKELWYESGVPMLPSKWSYCFDASGKLVSSYHWFSW